MRMDADLVTTSLGSAEFLLLIRLTPMLRGTAVCSEEAKAIAKLARIR